MKRFVPNAGANLKRKRLDELTSICSDLGVAPPEGKKARRADYEAALERFVASPEYKAHALQYTRYSMMPLAQTPREYISRERALRERAFEYMADEDKTYDECLTAVTKILMIPHVPMLKFDSVQRRELVRRAVSMDILRGLPLWDVLPCLERWPLALKFVPPAAQTLDMCTLCVRKSVGWALQYCAPALVTPALEEEAVRLLPAALEWVRERPGEREHYETLCLLAVTKDGWAVEHAKSPPPAVRLAAVRQDHTAARLLAPPLSAEEQAAVDAALARIAAEKKRAAANPVDVDAPVIYEISDD